MITSRECFQEDADTHQRAMEEGSKRMTAKYKPQLSGADG